MRIHLAARYEQRREMLRVARELEDGGHEITSRWLDGKFRGARPEDNAAYGLTDVVAADCIVLFTDRPPRNDAAIPGGGRHVEFGYAMRAGKRLAIVGPRENVFEYLPAVEQFRSVKGLVRGLR